MCGRYSFHLTEEEVSELTGSVPEPFPAPVFNQPPGVPVPVLGPGEEWDPMPWGAEMSVGPSRRRLVINARSETASEKRAFRESFASRRCVLPASGFFEWQRGAKVSQPYYFSPRTGPGILLGGIVLKSRGDGSSRVVVLTRAADPWMEEVHHRAPIIVRPDRLSAWLDRAEGGEEAIQRCAFGSEEESLQRHPVARRMSRVTENDPAIVDPVSPESTNEESGPVQGELFL
ncbi:MAG: SOS response-associated peptidase [Puniceicoccales bacterium]